MKTETQIRRLERKLRFLQERYMVPCPHCGKPILASAFASVAARRASAMRKKHTAGPGRPKKLSACKKCGELPGVAEVRVHHCC